MRRRMNKEDGSVGEWGDVLHYSGGALYGSGRGAVFLEKSHSHHCRLSPTTAEHQVCCGVRPRGGRFSPHLTRPAATTSYTSPTKTHISQKSQKVTFFRSKGSFLDKLTGMPLSV
jgi:hypothetical protein